VSVGGSEQQPAQAFILEFEYRSDNGPLYVGPFDSRDAAFDYARSFAGPGWEASYEAIPIHAPEVGRG